MKPDPARLIVPAIRDYSGSEKERHRWIEDYQKNDWAGYILFGGELSDVSDLTGTLRRNASNPPLIASDLERGPGQQFDGGTELPPAMMLAATADPAAVKQLAKLAAREAMKAGINCIFAPVLDLQIEPENPIVQERAFGSDPDKVSEFGNAFYEGIHSTDCLSVPKHFPGHGRTIQDSHMELPVVTSSRDELNQDLTPFRNRFRKGCNAVMAAHVSYTCLDRPDKPATVSRNILTDLLKNELGFNGLVFSDAMMMEGIKTEEPGEQAVRSLKAGIDVILYPESPEQLAEDLRNRMSEGSLSENLVQKKIEKIQNAVPEQNRSPSGIDTNVGRQSLEMALRGITSIGSAESPSSFRPREDNLVVVLDRGTKQESITLEEHLKIQDEQIHYWDLEQHRRFPGKLPESGTTWMALFSSTSGWKGSSGPEYEICNEINATLKKIDRSVFLGFCSPHSLRNIQTPDHSFIFYGTGSLCQHAASEFIKKSRKAPGKLPVEIVSS